MIDFLFIANDVEEENSAHGDETSQETQEREKAATEAPPREFTITY
jgi:hypothetical protein